MEITLTSIFSEIFDKIIGFGCILQWYHHQVPMAFV